VTAPRRVVLDVGDGASVVGDEVPATAPVRGPGYLYLHGLGSVRAGDKSASMFARAAAQGRAAVRYDQRGHGESAGVLGRVTVGELVADAVRMLTVHGPAVVVGSSLGGLIGAFAAAARPDLVRALVLLSPAVGFLARLEQRLDAAGRMWTQQGIGFVVEPRVLADARTLDEGALPARLSMPTLVVHGTADDVVPWQLGERLFQALAAPAKQLWLVPGGDHRLNTVIEQVWPRLDALLGDA
jgi:pimeloyl-ACP methyl ester carboxylesterase